MKLKLIRTLGVCALLCFGIIAHAQSRTITGTVLDNKGQGLIGAMVKEKGTTNGTYTNNDGKFTITVTTAEPVLVVASFGMKEKEVAVGSSNEMTISLDPSDETLGEVVVVALSQKKQAKSLGYSTETIGGDAVAGSGEQNAIQGLAGKSAGIQVIGSGGTPGSSSKILIRGNASFTRSNEPLIVVDGVPIDNSQGNLNGSGASDYPFNAGLGGVNSANRGTDINPADIASVTVLKGPAAAALYGARAGNGAIIITTKSGQSGKIRVSYGFDVDYSKVNKLPERQTKYGGGGSPGSGPGTTLVAADWGEDGVWFTGDDKSLGTPYSWGPEITDPVDNVGNFFRTGVTTNHRLAMSGGSENTVFRLSLGRTNVQGVIPNTDWDRTSVRVNAESQITEKLRVGGTANYINSGGTRVQNGSNLAGIMLALMRTPANFDLNPTWDQENGGDGYLTKAGYPRNAFYAYDNPWYSVNENTNEEKVNRIIGNVNASYELMDWINLSYRLGVDAYSDERQQRFGIHSWQPDPGPVGEMEEFRNNYRQIYSDFLVNMTKSLGPVLDAKLTVGNNLWVSTSTDVYSRGRQMAVPNFYSLSNFTELYTGNYAAEERTAALFFDGGLDYMDKIFLNFTGRNEWSSTFGEEQNNFFYPSVNTAIVLTEFVDVPSLDFGKLRIGYAESGISPAAYSSGSYYSRWNLGGGFTNGLSFPYLGVNGFSHSRTLGDPNLKPERQVGMEYGLDLRFLGGRLNLDVTYYDQTSKDILLSLPVASSSGYKALYTNAGEMNNKGWEITLDGTPIKGDFTWEAGINFSKNVNEVLKLADGVDEINIETAFSSIGSYAIVGYPYGALFGDRWLRANGEDNDEGPIVIDEDGYPMFHPTRGNIGNPFPDWTMNISNSFSWKGFTLSGLLDIREGGDIWAGTYARLTRHGVTKMTEDRDGDVVIEGVLEDGSANTTAIPKWESYVYYWGDLGAVEQAVYDGSWVRLRELSLGYTFDMDLKYVKSLNVYATGRNLWLDTEYPGVDPETSLTGSGSNNTGFDYFNNPGTKSYLFGVNVGF